MNKTKQDIRKDQILDAALTVLVQNGYERSRMDDVVQESQLSKGAIYWYYKSKKEMYLLDFNFKCLEVIFDCLQLDSTFTKTESYQKIIEDKTDLRHLVNTKQEQVQQFSNYTQVFNNKHGFLNNLSILDLLFNEGTNALSYLQSQKLIV